MPKCRFDGYAKILYFERNTRPILNLFFYLKRWNLSLDILVRITTIYFTVLKLFTYTGLEIVINFSQMPIWWWKFYILNGILDRFLICFFYLKRRNLSLDNLKRITTIHVTVWKLFTYTGLINYKFFRNSDLMGMR